MLGFFLTLNKKQLIAITRKAETAESKSEKLIPEANSQYVIKVSSMMC